MADVATEWDEWGDDDGDAVAPPDGAPSPVSDAPRALLDWAWDLAALDAELAALPSPKAPSVVSTTSWGPNDNSLVGLAVLAGPTRRRLREMGQRTRAMRAQATVAQLRLRRLARGLAPTTKHNETDDDLVALERELQELAGDWGRQEEGENDAADARTLHEMSSVLQHALATSDEEENDDGPVLFQQALEQLFASLPEQQLVVPVSWIRPENVAAPDANEEETVDDAFVARLVSLCREEDVATTRVTALADAQVFQDTKDVQRDELVVDGEHVVGGAVGYEAVVDTIVAHLRTALAVVDRHDDDDNDDHATLLRHAAQHILTACNRTESGGCSYEILSQFVTQHSTHRVLIRPASARAPPLEIASDVGVFYDRDAGWSFGLRVRIAAVTWYCVCDAEDPTRELCAVETTYRNRLAFPLGLTPLAPRRLLRRDGGDVTIALRLDSGHGEGEL